MGTVTAQILVGSAHPNHGGIGPSHYLMLHENSRPAWVIQPYNNGVDKKNAVGKITWIPTLENMLEDALLMIAINVLKDPEIKELAGRCFNNKQKHWVELYDDVNQEDLQELYEKCRSLKTPYKVVITVLEGSTIRNQLKVLEKYNMDVEVCIPVYSRYFSEWQNETIINGTL